MKIFNPLAVLNGLFNREHYNPDFDPTIDFEWKHTQREQPFQKSKTRFTNVSLPLEERLRRIDERITLLNEQLPNLKETK